MELHHLLHLGKRKRQCHEGDLSERDIIRDKRVLRNQALVNLFWYRVSRVVTICPGRVPIVQLDHLSIPSVFSVACLTVHA